MLRSRFEQFLSAEKRTSYHTRIAYMTDLDQAAGCLAEKFQLDLFEETHARSVTHRMLRIWLAALQEAGCAPRTTARKLSSVRAYFRFLKTEGKVPENPASRLRAPKLSKRLPVFLKETEAERLFEKSECIPADPFEAARDQLLLELLYGCGLRRAEVISLKLCDVDITKRQLRVHGKGGKDRILPFSEAVEASLRRYLALGPSQPDPTAPLLRRPNGAPLYPNLVYRIVRARILQVAALKKYSPHVLRHTFATHLLDRGADLNAIKELLGHTSLAATQVYTHNTIAKLKSVHDQAHPRAGHKVKGGPL